MKIFLEGVPDLFSALWVATNNPGGDIKQWLEIKRKKGITNPDAVQRIKNQYQIFSQFQADNTLYARLELFFNRNFGVISQKLKSRISFKYRSENWSQMLFLKQTTNSVEYLDVNIKDILPILSKDDCLLNLPLNEICGLYGKTPPAVELSDESLQQWQDDLGVNILVYKHQGERIDILKDQISTGSADYAETMQLTANEEAYEVNIKYSI